MSPLIKKKKLAIIIILTVISGAVGSYHLSYYLGAKGTAFVGLEEDPWGTQPLQEAAYIIGLYNSTHYYARNHTGYGTEANEGYEFLSDNASYVFQSTIDGLSSDGGTLFFKVGTYPIDYIITVDDMSITFQGEVSSSTIWTGGVEFNLGANGGFNITHTSFSSWVNFYDILFYGDGATTNYPAIQYRNPSYFRHSHIERCTFNNFLGSGVPTLDIQNWEQGVIKDSWFIGTAYAHIFYGSYNYDASNVIVENSEFSFSTNNTYGIYLNGTGALRTYNNHYLGGGTEVYAVGVYSNAGGGILMTNDRCEYADLFHANTTGTKSSNIHILSCGSFVTASTSIIVDFTNVERSSVIDTMFRRGGSTGSPIGIKTRNMGTEGKRSIICNNHFQYSSETWYGARETMIDCANSTDEIYSNAGWNPNGYIETPINGTFIVDNNAWNVSAIANNTEYTCVQSPKNIYISGGTILNIYVNGEVVFTTTNVMVHLESGDTFEIEWSSTPTIKVMGS